MSNLLDKAIFGGGCFWCTEAVFQRLDGVLSVEPGYSDGETDSPNYKEICTGTTGHAEVIQITYDAEKISYLQLLKVFFETHDPTTLNKQGYDAGTQYRSIILTSNDTQLSQAKDLIGLLSENNVYSDSIVTEVKALSKFYLAEQYHHNYYKTNPNQGYCRAVIVPKVEKLEKSFSELLKKQ